MKTLNEVIKTLELCSMDDNPCDKCPYTEFDKNGEWACSMCGDFAQDELHYLKELRHILDNIIWVESTKEENGYWKLPTLPETGNDPLTWDELKQMEGKPVWIEVDGNWWGKFWAFVETANENYMNFFQKGQEYPEDLWKRNMGKTWQAYRKERMNETN